MDLVEKCKESLKNNDLETALKFWDEIHDTYIFSDRKSYEKWHEQMERFTDEEVYKITDYGREKAYREMEVV